MVSQLLTVMGAGPVLSLRADPAFGPLAAVFLLPYAAALAGVAITAAWAIKLAVLPARS